MKKQSKVIGAKAPVALKRVTPTPGGHDGIAEAKRRLPLSRLMVDLGHGDSAKKSSHCPFHEDASASFSLYVGEDGVERWKCHAGCGGGDVIDFLAKFRGLSNADACREYTRLAGNETPPPAVKCKLPPVVSSPFDFRPCIDAFDENEMQKMATARGYSVEFVQWLHAQGVVGVLDGNTAFANHDDNGKVVSAHHRLDNGDWRFKPKGQRTAPLIFGKAKTAGYILTFESQWDAFAVMNKLGWHTSDGVPDTAVFITRGGANGKLVRKQFLPEAVCYAFRQNDEPNPKTGIRAGDEWLDCVATQCGCKCAHVVTPSPHKDPNDWTRAGATKQDLEAAIAAAKVFQPVIAAASEKPPAAQPDSAPSLDESVSDVHGFQDPRPKIELPGDNRLISEFARDLGKAVRNAEIFQRGGLAWSVNDRGDGLVQMTDDRLRSWLEKYAVCYKRRAGSGGMFQFRRTMTTNDANGVLNASQFISELREICQFNLIPMPVRRPTGSIVLLTPGYDEGSKTFTANHSQPVSETMSANTAKSIIDEILSEFKFTDTNRSKAVAVSAMLTVYAVGILPPKSIRPCFVYMANAEGAGKSLLVKIATVPVLGKASTGVLPKDEQEMRKLLLSAVMETKPVIIFDNVKGRLESPALEGFITAQDYSGRILGGQQTFDGENKVTVFITGNGCTVSPDIRRRSLFCELFQEEERAEDRKFKKILEVSVILARRTEILSALWTFIKEWDKAGGPKPNRSHASFPEWANTIAAIVEHAGYGCPLETPNSDVSADVDGSDMRELVKAISGSSQQKPLTFDALVEVAKSRGLFERFTAGMSTKESQTSSRASMGRVLSSYDRRIFGGWRFLVIGKAHQRRFQVEKAIS